MTTVAQRPDRTRSRRHGLRWYREILYTLAFYGVYTFVRNTQGSAKVGAIHAFNNAKKIIKLERWMGLYHEETLQEIFLRSPGFIRSWNVFYGSAHFVVTFGAMVWCFLARPDRYPRLRNALACMTGFALIGFALFPLMPPRLLPASYGFVDTLKVVGGLWNFDSGAVAKVSNQYAAMPSLHVGWAAWCGIALWPLARTWKGKAIIVGHPFATVFGIVVTGNHFLLDAGGGLVAFSAGMMLGRAITRAWERHHERLDFLTAVRGVAAVDSLSSGPSGSSGGPTLQKTE